MAMFVQRAIFTGLGLTPTMAIGPRSQFMRCLPDISIPVLVAAAPIFLSKSEAHVSAKEKVKVHATVTVIGDLTFGLMYLRIMAVLLFLAKHRRAWPKLVKRANAVLQKISMKDSSYPIFYCAWHVPCVLSLNS